MRCSILFGGASAIYVGYIYKTYIIGNFHNFPEPVAKKLRRALHYSNIELNPQKAVDYYKQALAVADEVGMDPFSDEILGVKIALAGFMERIHQYQRAIDVLEIVRRDCNKWLDTVGKREGREGDRTRVLAKTVGISVKLGELYANEYVGDQDAAEKNLIAGVEISLRERQRREEEGVKEDEGPWMSNEEMGGALECTIRPVFSHMLMLTSLIALANHYEQKDLHYLAAPLYLQCLSLLPHTSCHAVVLMNNLSISLAQQPSPPTSSIPPPSRSALISNARSWAEKSLSIAAQIKPPERNEECDMGCAVATHNLGEFAEMDGNLTEARKKYEEAKSLSKAIGFFEGVERADEGIKRVGSA
jgi:tetratricopeptide (TPR) repeat protein